MCLAVIHDFSQVTFDGVFKVSAVWEVAVALPLKTGETVGVSAVSAP